MIWNDVFLKLYPQKAKGVEPEKIPWDDTNYIWEEKFDGDRRLLWITDKGNFNTSRNESKKTGLPTDKTDNTPHLRDLKLPGLEGTILDGEFDHPKGFEYVRKIMGALPDKAIKTQEEYGKIIFRVYDIICYKGKFIIDLPLIERKRILLEKIFQHENFKFNQEIKFVMYYKDVNKIFLEELFQEIVARGGEGLIAKNKQSKYRLSTEKCVTCLKNDWVKVKKEYNGDFVVIGYEEPTREFEGKTNLDDWLYWSTKLDGTKTPITKNYYMHWIGGIIYGDYQDGILTKAGVLSSSCFDEATRDEISKNKEKYMGKVIEINAMSRDPKERTVRHATFSRWRDDKEPEDCIYENQKG